MKNLIKELKKFKNDKIAILSHEFPDGDCIGSSLALAFLLKKRNNEAIIINKNSIPKCYDFLQKTIKIKKLNSISKKILNSIKNIVTIDSVNEIRLGYNIKEIFINTKKIINIDHHISNVGFGNINYIQKAGATAEIIFYIYLKFFKNIEVEPATALYTGIMTDTGNLTYESTSYETVKAVSKLYKMGAETNLMRKELYEKETIKKIDALKEVLNNLKFINNNKIVYSYLNYNTIKKLNLSFDEIDDYINYLKKIKTAEIALFFKEIKKNKIKASIRTKSLIDANKIANLFKGGGHLRAAGFKKEGDFEKVIIESIMKIKEKLNNEWNYYCS